MKGRLFSFKDSATPQRAVGNKDPNCQRGHEFRAVGIGKM
jgi:hypothetical protein